MVKKLKQNIQLLVCLITCFGLCSSVFAQALEAADKELRFYTEISPPYFWLDENNQPKGASYDIALALMAHTKLDGVIEQLPWARAYVEATTKPDIVLLTALRTEKREKQLQWLGTVHTDKAHLFALKNNSKVQLVDFEDAKQYLVGTIRGYGSVDFLINNGFSEGNNLKLLSSQKQLWSMLFKGRIDLVLDNFTTTKFEVLNAGFDVEDVKSLLKIDALTGNLEMATGNLTDRITTQRLRIGFQQLKDIGTYKQIMAKWGLAE
jgi:polar amino acid transport system substrate-binding protein